MSEFQVNKILHNFTDAKEAESLLTLINSGDIVNSWVYETEPFPNEDKYYALMPVSDFFHVDEDLLDYYDPDYFQQNTDWHKLWTLSDMASKIDSLECTSIYHLERDGLIISVEANLHGQNGLYFDNLRIFESLEALFLFYKELGGLVFRHTQFYSHGDAEMLSLYNLYIPHRI